MVISQYLKKLTVQVDKRTEILGRTAPNPVVFLQGSEVPMTSERSLMDQNLHPEHDDKNKDTFLGPTMNLNYLRLMNFLRLLDQYVFH